MKKDRKLPILFCSSLLNDILALNYSIGNILFSFQHLNILSNVLLLKREFVNVIK